MREICRNDEIGDLGEEGSNQRWGRCFVLSVIRSLGAAFYGLDGLPCTLVHVFSLERKRLSYQATNWRDRLFSGTIALLMRPRCDEGGRTIGCGREQLRR